MSRFLTVREPITVQYRDQSHTFHIRELGYLEFKELRESVVAKHASEPNAVGIAIMHAVVLASVQEEDGSPSYTDKTWRTEVESVVTKLGKAAMKAQGWDIDELASQEPLTEEQSEGNVEPSRKSGANSPSTSAAPLENSKAV